MSGLQKVNLGTPPTAVDGDSTRTAFTKVNSNVDVLNTQAALTSLAALTSTRSLTKSDLGQRITFIFSGTSTRTIPMPSAATCGADSVILLRNAGAGPVSLTPASSTSDTVALSKLNPGETALMTVDGVSAWTCLIRGRANTDNESVIGNSAVGGDASVAGALGVTGAATLSSTLTVTGAATLNSTLAAKGAVTFGSAGQASISAAGAYSGTTGTYSGNVAAGSLTSPNLTSSGALAIVSSANVVTFAANGAERGRFDTSGGFHVGETSAWSSGAISARSFAANAWGVSSYAAYQTNGGCFLGRVEATATAFAAFFFGANPIGTITTSNGTSTSYNTTSDYRLKANYVSIPDAAVSLQRIKFYQGEFKAAPGELAHYVLAHELQEVVPLAVTGEKDALGDWYVIYRDGHDPADVKPEDVVSIEQEIVPQAVDYSKLVPLLGAALQEAHALLQDARDRIASLESKAR